MILQVTIRLGRDRPPKPPRAETPWAFTARTGIVTAGPTPEETVRALGRYAAVEVAKSRPMIVGPPSWTP